MKLIIGKRINPKSPPQAETLEVDTKNSSYKKYLKQKPSSTVEG